MAAWRIAWTRQAVQDMARLETPVAQRVARKVEQAAADPRRFFVRLAGADEYRLRIGDYRLVAALLPATRTVLVKAVDHRSRVYGPR